MSAWVELFQHNPAACICLLAVALGGTAAIINAIRRQGGS